MTMQTIISVLNAEVIVQGDKFFKELNHVVVSDLMSDVLLVDEDDMLLVTSLASDQVLRTAQIVGAAAVLVVNGKSLPSSMKKVAQDLHMTLAVSQHSKFNAVVAIHHCMPEA